MKSPIAEISFLKEALLELDDRPQPQHSSIAEFSSRPLLQGIGRPAAQMDDVLKIRLQRPTGTHLILIDVGQQLFTAAHRSSWTWLLLKVEIERSRPG
jgi:hypothetical protein